MLFWRSAMLQNKNSESKYEPPDFFRGIWSQVEEWGLCNFDFNIKSNTIKNFVFKISKISCFSEVMGANEYF